MRRAAASQLFEPNAAPWRFVGRFVLYWCAAILACALFPAIEQVFLGGTQAPFVALLQGLGLSPSVDGDVVSTGPVRARIAVECTPLLAAQVLFAAILAYPASWRDRIVGLGVGSAVLWVVNLLRIGVLLAIMWHSPRHFDLVHTGVWQMVLLLTVVGVFVLWERWSTAGRLASVSPEP